MDKQYQNQEFEKKIYGLWEKSGGFQPKDDGKPFTIIMPPPNANDPLHIGHAMFVTVEDILIRYHRMLGEAALWLPGTDHAGIETQYVFEKKLKKEGKSRFNFDRETLYQKIWDYVQENSGIAVEQMKSLGASADWDRYKFTLDKDIVSLVMETFEKLYESGLIYRDIKLVNYCTRCGTAFSDLEIKHVTQKAPLYYMKYGPFTLATVRPETKFGDTAVAVNPEDPRYKIYVGKEIEVEGILGKFKMKVIADSYVDREFGTGVVKVTPAHDQNDFAMWQRHKGEIPGPKQVIGFDGRLNELCGKYAGLKIAEAREAVAIDLEKAGLLEKIDQNYEHNLGVCYRCGTPLEPLPLVQFWVKVKSLAERALKALQNKEVKIYGAGHDKILRHWLENLEDWNISRQIVWGIRLPIWYAVEAEQNADIEITFLEKGGKTQKGKLSELRKQFSLKEIKNNLQSLRAPVKAEYMVSPTSPGENYIQETDTFDTWFSSAQWPVVTLKASQHQDDWERFYPTQVMETAYDILPFWVMRMLMMGLYLTGKVPFEKVYFHGLIRDGKGQKMSKSKGNVVNPLTVVEKYGADALRMALVIRSTAGLDKGVGEGDFRAMRNLTNKIWNAARYILLNKSQRAKVKSQNNKDKEFKKRLDKIVKNVTKKLDDLRVGLAAETVYKEFWHWFCDVAIEKNKKQEISDQALLEGLVVFLKLLHPFVPFVTEAVYQELGVQNGEKLLMVEKWPT